MHLTELTRDDLPDLARGAALLGAGGGGDPYIGRLIAEQAMDEFGPARILSPDDVPDDMLICSVAAMGATNIQMEKLIAGNEMPHAVHVLERYLGERVGALIPAEIGGSNSLLPLVLGVRQGLPVIDADGMGRAFPELQMNSFSINGVRAGPLVVVDEHLNTAIVDATTDKMAEDMTRALAIRMGLRVYLSCFPMTGRQMRETAIHNTLSAARRIGAASRAPMQSGAIDHMIDTIRDIPTYGAARRLFDGKIADVDRQTSRGFSVGSCTIDALGSGARASIEFQNENLLCRIDDALIAVTPDLICIVDSETGEPITTPHLRYGQRVCVLAIRAPERMRTPQALAAFGPSAFGIDAPYEPLTCA